MGNALSSTRSPLTTGEWLVNEARSWLGTNYVWGGTSRSGIDCSGLVQAIYAAAGIQIPRVTYDQIGTGASVPMNKLQAGDLVFFDTDRTHKGPDHVGIYIGGGKFIHAPRTGDVVKVSSLTDSFYANRWMGGRRIAGVTTSDDYGEAVAQAPQVRLSKAELAENYGMSYAFFKSQPSLMKLLDGAVSEQWSPQLFQAHLKNTDWWKKNSAPMRAAQVLQKTDPASYNASIQAAQAAVASAAVQAGAILSTKEASRLAKNMVTLGWNEAQVQNVLGQYVDFNDKHVLGGQAGAAATQLEQYSYANGVQASEQTVKTQAAYLVRGITSMEQLQAEIRQQAAGAYPGFADQINAGATMRDIAQPYIQVVAQELGLPESDVDVWHPKVRAALTRANAKGEPEPMSLTDFQSYVRDDPSWRKTPSAINNVMTVGRQVLSDMGLVR